MKLKLFITEALKVICYLLAILGGFCVVNTLGALEVGRITVSQFFIYEFISFVIFVSAFIVYYIRKKFIKKYFNK